MNKKAQMSFFIVTLFTIAIVIAIATAMVPLIKNLNEFTHTEGEFLLNESKLVAATIENSTYRTTITNNIDAAINEGIQNKDIIDQLNKYSWVIAVALISVTVFIFTRQQINLNSGII